MKQLVLQGLGSGGDNDLATRTQRRHQIGKGFAGTGASLGNQYASAVNGSLNFLGHFNLALPMPKTFDTFCEWAIWPKKLG